LKYLNTLTWLFNNFLLINYQSNYFDK
jgi:hypothetical protein